MIYHVLTDEERFSEANGGAISRWAANMAKSSDTMVVCLQADNTWRFPPHKIFYVDRLKYYKVLRLCHLLRPANAVRSLISPWMFSSLIDVLKTGDVVWFHNRPDHATALAPRLNAVGVYVVLHMHNSLPVNNVDGAQKRMLRNLPTVFCSQYLIEQAKLLCRGPLNRSYVLHNGADGTLFYPRTQADRKRSSVPTILYVGRLVPYKGVHVLLEAMRILQRRGVYAICKIIGAASFGSHNPSKYVRKLMQSCPSNTSFEGYKSGKELAEEFRASDLFCCPSIWKEPFGMVNVEAMASGIPVIASNVGGIHEALQYGGGILVPANDADALATALQSLIEDSDLRTQLGTQALTAFNEHFAWRKLQMKYRQILDEITT